MASHGNTSFHHSDPSCRNSELGHDILMARSPQLGTSHSHSSETRRESMLYNKSPHHGRKIVMDFTARTCSSPSSCSTNSFIYGADNSNAMYSPCSLLRSPESSREPLLASDSRACNIHLYGHDEKSLHMGGSKWEDAQKWLNGNVCTPSKVGCGVKPLMDNCNDYSFPMRSPQHSYYNHSSLHHNPNPKPKSKPTSSTPPPNNIDIILKSYPTTTTQTRHVDCDSTSKYITNIDTSPLQMVREKKGNQCNVVDVNKHIIINHEPKESKIAHWLQSKYCNVALTKETNTQHAQYNYATGRQVPQPTNEECKRTRNRDDESGRLGSREPTMFGSYRLDMMSKGHLIEDAIVTSKLREVGTQITSTDGSPSTSRYPSKVGTPSISPARHNTPARIRSMRLSNNGDEIDLKQQMHEYRLNVEEVVYCHRAKLELQELSEGERIGQSFHWTSRDAEEADLSTSLRRYDNCANYINYISHHPKLAKLRQKEEKIEAWEKHTKEKANAQLKKLEEQLEKKRVETTNKILERLAITQRKAEEKRANILTQQKKVFVKPQRYRRNLSPTLKALCFNFVAEPY